MNFTGILLLLVANLPATADDVPGWLREVASSKLTTYPPKVPAVTLIDETRLTVDESGRIVNHTRKAIKVLTREGRGEAYGFHIYSSGTAKVREARAWMIAPSGDTLKIGKEQTADRAYVSYNAYDDLRVRELDGRSKADPESVFGFEFVTEEAVPFAQTEWYFQQRLPVLLSRYILELPPNWTAQGIVYNHPGLEPKVEGSRYTWELRGLGYVEPEPLSPPLFSLVPRVAISYFPPAGAKSPGSHVFSSWTDVSRWVSEAADPQAEPSPAITAKALELTKNAKTEYARILSIANYVQLIRYVSIQTGLGRGGGYRPKAAADVFVKDYGDCKDKATLMRAMLKAIGIGSYLVTIYSGDRAFVREDWRSPQQFNHAIIAVKVSPETRAAAILDDPKLGRLLFFDPTSGTTSFGDLPRPEQGSLALVAAGEQGALLRMPSMLPSFNQGTRETRAVLGEDGSIRAEFREDLRGQEAASARTSYYGQPEPEFRKIVERAVTRGANGAAVSKVEPHDELLQGRFSLDVAFEAPHYGQLKGNRLLVFRPAIMGRREGVFLVEPKREHEVQMNASAWREVVRIKLPAGFQVDEKPDPRNLQTPFGHYSATFEVKDGELVFTREWELQNKTIPVAQYAEVRKYYETILAAEQEPVVLVRK
jgi:hypothetical protein